MRELTDEQIKHQIPIGDVWTDDNALSEMILFARTVISEFCRINGLTGEAQPAEQAKGREAVGSVYISHHKGMENRDFDYWGNLPDGSHMLYTTPPAQPAREWVGLNFKDWNDTAYTADFRAGAEWAESKLREKNAGLPAADAYTKALEIRTAQGWKLTGKAIPVLYTDTINGEQVCRDDVWLCTTDALRKAADDKAGGYEPVAWTPTEQQCQEWLQRHGLHPADRDAFFDAASLYLQHTHPQPQAEALRVPDERRPIGGINYGWEGEYNRGWNDCRSAILAAAPQPAAQTQEKP